MWNRFPQRYLNEIKIQHHAQNNKPSKLMYMNNHRRVAFFESNYRRIKRRISWLNSADYVFNAYDVLSKARNITDVSGSNLPDGSRCL